jgi:outer membrane protein TolC
MPSDVATPRPVFIFILAAALGGCSLTGDGFAPVQDVALREIGAGARIIATQEEAEEARAATQEWLRRPLTAESAARIALINNRALQAAYNELGIAQAALLRASLPPNPRIGWSRTTGVGELEIEREILLGLFGLVTLPARREIAAENMRAAQMRGAEATMRTALEARRQYFRAVGAAERVAALREIKVLTDATADLAKKMGETGGMNKLDQAREYALAAETDNLLARARLDERLERERLTRALGLWGEQTALKLPARLPSLPAAARAAPDVEAQAVARRVDLQAARHDLAALAASLGLTQATRLVSDVELIGARARHSETGGDGARESARTTKIGLELEIPLFDFGAARAQDAEQRYMRAANLLADKAVRVRSEAREAYAAYRGMHQIARHHQMRILPLRQTIQEESLLHYSGMLIDVTDLINDTKAQIAARMQAIDAKRDFWIAENEMRAALAGGGGGAAISGGGGAPPAASGAAGH